MTTGTKDTTKATTPSPASPPPGPSGASDSEAPVAFYSRDRCGHALVPLSDEQVYVLLNDLNRARVANRSQGGASLSYLEAWDVKATLTKVFGFGGYSSELLEYRLENTQPVEAIEWSGPSGNRTKAVRRDADGNIVYNHQITVSARVQLHIHQLGVFYTEGAAASQTGPDFGEVMDFALKTAESDALKRAAINLGTQFGLSLYASDKQNVHYDDVIRVVLAPAQKGARDRHAAALKAKREAEIPEPTPVASPEPEEPASGEATATPPARSRAPQADTTSPEPPNPQTADSDDRPMALDGDANIDWAKEAMLLGDVGQVREWYKKAARAGAAPAALKAIEQRGLKLAKLQEDPAAAQDAAVDQIAAGFKHEEAES